MSLISNLEALLASGKDSPALRFALATRYFAAGDPLAAARHAEAAVALDGEYSAAWKLLGQAHAGAGDTAKAAESYRRGIEVAEQRGDVQAAKEMRVFLKRLETSAGKPLSREP
jgi:predicted Zn-dependent protease